MAMTNDDGGGFVFVNLDTGTVDPATGPAYIVDIGALDSTEADTLNGCEDWGAYSPEARAIIERHGARVADLVRPAGGFFFVNSGPVAAPMSDAVRAVYECATNAARYLVEMLDDIRAGKYTPENAAGDLDALEAGNVIGGLSSALAAMASGDETAGATCADCGGEILRECEKAAGVELCGVCWYAEVER